MAMDKPWHPEHFLCRECNKSLRGIEFIEHDGYPYCVEDYYGLFGNKCAGCGEPIKEVCYGVVSLV